MILEIVLALFVGSFVSIGGYLLSVAVKNHKKYQFFKKNAPNLPVLPNPSLFGGHNSQLVYAKYNWALGEEHFQRLNTKTYGFYCGSKPFVSTIDLEFIKTFIIDEQQHTNRVILDLPLREIEADCIMFAEDKQWLRLRKSIAPAFSAHKIKMPNVQQDVDEIVGKVIASFERKLGQLDKEEPVELDALDFAHRYSLALVFKNFYKQDDVVDFNASEDHWASLIDRSLRNLIGYTARMCAIFPIVKPLINWIIVNFHHEGVMRHTILNYIKEQTIENFKDAKRTEDGSTGDSKFRRNMIDFISDEFRLGKLTKDEYFNSTFFLFFAATSTTSDAVSRLLFNLARHPEVQEKLRRSVLEFGADSEYLTWVVNETLRLHPPAPIGASRTIKRDITTSDGCLVPAGTFVVTHTTLINRLKQYWGEDADEFRPERWAKASEFHPCQFMSFGGGRRVCPGRELAQTVIKKLANELLRRYKFERSLLYPGDNSRLYDAPILAFTLFDTPTYVRISRLGQSI